MLVRIHSKDYTLLSRIASANNCSGRCKVRITRLFQDDERQLIGLLAQVSLCSIRHFKCCIYSVIVLFSL